MVDQERDEERNPSQDKVPDEEAKVGRLISHLSQHHEPHGYSRRDGKAGDDDDDDLPVGVCAREEQQALRVRRPALYGPKLERSLRVCRPLRSKGRDAISQRCTRRAVLTFLANLTDTAMRVCDESRGADGRG